MAYPEIWKAEVLRYEPPDRVTPAVRQLRWLPPAERVDYKLYFGSQDITWPHAGVHRGYTDTSCRHDPHYIRR